MLTFKDADGSGVVLRDSGEAHTVGEDANMPPEKGVKPKPGEIYLHFTNVESAKALRLTPDEAIAEMANEENTLYQPWRSAPLKRLSVILPDVAASVMRGMAVTTRYLMKFATHGLRF